MFMLPLFALLRQIAPSVIPCSINLFIPENVNSYHSLWDSKETSDPVGRMHLIESSPMTSFLSMTLTRLTLLHRFLGSCFLFDISFSPSSFVLSCSCEMLQDLSSNHLPILFTVALSPVFRPMHDPLSLIFRKLVGKTLLFTLILTVFLQMNIPLFLFPLLLISLFLTFGTKCGQIIHIFRKCQTPTSSLLIF